MSYYFMDKYELNYEKYILPALLFIYLSISIAKYGFKLTFLRPDIHIVNVNID